MYNPNTSAVPVEVIQKNFDKIKQGKLHPKRPNQSIRREMTERRISQNILLYNSAANRQDKVDLFIGVQKPSINDSQLSMMSNKYLNQSAGGPYTLKSTERISLGASMDQVSLKDILRDRKRNLSLHNESLMRTSKDG